MDLELRGKNVIITGASNGIGYACAAGFAAEGCRLHIASRSAAALEEARAKLVKHYGVEVTWHPYDLSVTANAAALGRACGDIDILVPVKTPKEIIATIRSTVVTVLNNTAVIKRLGDLGYISIGDQPDEFAAHIKSEIEQLGKILREHSVTAD